MKRDDFNIMADVKTIESLKAQLLCMLGQMYYLLTKGSNVEKEAILESISGSIILLYALGEKLGYSPLEIDEDMKEKLRIGIIEEDDLEKQGRCLSKIYDNIKKR